MPKLTLAVYPPKETRFFSDLVRGDIFSHESVLSSHSNFIFMKINATTFINLKTGAATQAPYGTIAIKLPSNTIIHLNNEEKE